MIPSYAIMGMSSEYENMAKKVQDFAQNKQESLNQLLYKFYNFFIRTICTEKGLQEFNKIQDSRNVTWFKYMNGIHMKDSRLPLDNKMYTHTSHIFYMLLPTSKIREDFIQYMKKHKIQTVSHYEPLHNSIAGKKYGKSSGAYLNTINISQTIVRLPIWKGLPVNSQNRIIDLINNYKAS
jgi:dTDP-4-amino-4,6-dideoxygalactose transaminase